MNEMQQAYREWVATGLAQKGKTYGGLAKVLGVHQSQVTRMLNGDRRIALTEVPLIAKYLGAPPPGSEPAFEAEGPDESTDRMVKVVGYVGAGAEAHFYAVSQGDLDEVPAPIGSSANTVAVEIRGESLGKSWERALVFYDDVRRPITPDLLGKLCVVELDTGQILVKRVVRARQRDRFHLLSDNGPNIENVVINWAAKVSAVVPR